MQQPQNQDTIIGARRVPVAALQGIRFSCCGIRGVLSKIRLGMQEAGSFGCFDDQGPHVVGDGEVQRVTAWRIVWVPPPMSAMPIRDPHSTRHIGSNFYMSCVGRSCPGGDIGIDSNQSDDLCSICHDDEIPGSRFLDESFHGKGDSKGGGDDTSDEDRDIESDRKRGKWTDYDGGRDGGLKSWTLESSEKKQTQ